MMEHNTKTLNLTLATWNLCLGLANKRKGQTQLGCPLFDYGAVVLRCLFFIKNVLHIQKFENKPI